MKTVKYSLAFFTLLAGLVASSQQGTLKLDLGYKVAAPTGNFKNITDKASLNGWEAALMYGFTDQVSLGVQTGFQDFYQKYDRQVFHTAGSDLSAIVTNSVQVIPVLLKGAYTFTESSTIQPFVAVGVGGNLIQYRKYYGQFAESRSSFGFMAQPELGIQIPVGKLKRTGLRIAAAYNYAPFEYGDADGLHHASVKAGLSIPLR